MDNLFRGEALRMVEHAGHWECRIRETALERYEACEKVIAAIEAKPRRTPFEEFILRTLRAPSESIERQGEPANMSVLL